MNAGLSKFITILGVIAGTLTTLSFVPQLVRTWNSRRAHDISGWWLGAFMSGVALWLVYGLLLPSLPIIVANAATFALTVPILVMKLSYRDRRE